MVEVYSCTGKSKYKLSNLTCGKSFPALQSFLFPLAECIFLNGFVPTTSFFVHQVRSTRGRRIPQIPLMHIGPCFFFANLEAVPGLIMERCTLANVMNLVRWGSPAPRPFASPTCSTGSRGHSHRNPPLRWFAKAGPYVSQMRASWNS